MSLLVDSRPCAGCRGPRGPICDRCAPAFSGPIRRVHRSGLLTFPVVASTVYDGPVREALVAFKDHGRWSLRDPLGLALYRSVSGLVRAKVRQGLRAQGEVLPDDPDEPPVLDLPPEAIGDLLRVLLVPVPSSPGSVRARDGDHVCELAERVEELLPRRAEADTLPGLVVVRRRRDQVGLGRRERAANLRGSMRATDVLVRRAARPGTAVVLVDDIVTTGASLAEAHRALAAAGIWPWGAAVVAATPDLPRRGRPAAR